MALRRQILVLGLLLSFLGGPRVTAIKCKSNIDSKGQVGTNEVTKDCAAEGFNSCFTMTLVDKYDQSKVLWTMKGCQNMTVSGLYCMKNFQGVDAIGNCLNWRQKKSGWDYRMKECVTGERGDWGDVISQEHYVRVCTCNDRDECNDNCECDDSYSLCGRRPCPTYKCYCEGVSPYNNILFPGNCTAEGYRVCVGEEKTGCYTVAQEGTRHIYRDCALPYGMVNCIHTINNRMKPAAGPGDCVTGTNGDFIDVGHGWCNLRRNRIPNQARQMLNDDKKARIKACRCSGEYCNRNTELDWKHTPLKGSGVGRLEKATWALGFGLMITWIGSRI